MSRLVLMGSGETSPSLVAVHREGLSVSGEKRVTILDSPAGFQENSPQLLDRIATFFHVSLGAASELASLPHRDSTPVEVALFEETVGRASYLFAGPGSPTYALDVWERHRVGDLLVEAIRRGAVVTLASAAALTAGTRTIPVYEIYKVGAEPYLRTGLNLTGALGLPLMVVPHWNNAEGGNHDTSRCFIGKRRFNRLVHEAEVSVLGVDEHTAAIFDLAVGRLRVAGLGTVTIIGEQELVLPAGESVSLSDVGSLLGTPVLSLEPEVVDPVERSHGVEELLGALLALEEKAAEDPGRRQDLRRGLVELARAAEMGLIDPKEIVGDYVALLLELRAAARRERRFEEADRIRDGLVDLGVEVHDTPAGPRWEMR